MMNNKKTVRVTLPETKERNKTEGQFVDELTEQVSKNIISLLEEKNITQKTLANETCFAESCISEYKKGDKLPPLSFFLAIKKKYGISIDDFLTRNITPADYSIELSTSALELEELEDYHRFEGTYYAYYFDTSNYKGRDYNSAEEALMFGIIHQHIKK